MTDQQRADYLGCPGYPALHTPNLDRLAAAGCASTAPTSTIRSACRPASTSSPARRRAATACARTESPRPGRPAVTVALARAGYRTHAVGKILRQLYGRPTRPSRRCSSRRSSGERRMWQQRRVGHLPLPYYGFQTAEVTLRPRPRSSAGTTGTGCRPPTPGRRIAAFRGGQRPASGAEQAAILDIPPEWHYNTWVADRTIGFLDDHTPSDQPFFLHCSFPIRTTRTARRAPGQSATARRTCRRSTAATMNWPTFHGSTDRPTIRGCA